MKVKWIFLAICCLCLTSMATAKDKGTSFGSADYLLKKIDRGVTNGNLTRNEANKLYNMYDDFLKCERKAWRDGRISKREQRMLDDRYDRLELAIYKESRDRNTSYRDRSNTRYYDSNRYSYNDRNRTNTRQTRNSCGYSRNW